MLTQGFLPPPPTRRWDEPPSLHPLAKPLCESEICIHKVYCFLVLLPLFSNDHSLDVVGTYFSKSRGELRTAPSQGRPFSPA